MNGQGIALSGVFRMRGLSDRLVEMLAPRRENPLFGLLVRRWRRNLHGVPDVALWFSIVLAVVSALLVPTGRFSFHVWHAISYSVILWPALRFAGELRGGGAGTADLLVSPLPARRYVQALRGLFALSALHAAVPYAVYWLMLFALKVSLFPGLFAGWPNGILVTGAVLYFAALSSLLWLTLWCAAAGGLWMTLPALIIPAAVAAYGASPGRFSGTEPFPVTPALWLATFNLLPFGHLISLGLGKSLLKRIYARS